MLKKIIRAFKKWFDHEGSTRIAPPTAVGIVFAFSFLVSLMVVSLSRDNFSFSEASKSGLPKVELTGTLEVTIFDHEDPKKVKTLVELKEEKSSKKYVIEIPGDFPEKAKTGDKVKIRGKKKDDQTVVLSQANGTGEIQVLSAAPAAVAGDQKTLVIIANFTNAAVPSGPSAIQSLMFTDPNNKSVDDIYQESSYGKMSFSGDVAGPYTINYSTTSTCNIDAWASEARNLASAQGFNIASYTRRLYVLPSSNGCGYSGISDVGGSPSDSWIFRSDLKDIFAHELGHAVGMGHSSTATNTYGDTSDIMGYSGLALRQFNAPHKEQMGWVTNGSTITASGRYELGPLELNPVSSSKPLILRLAKPDGGGQYFLSYRQPIGFDATLATNYQNVLTIHRHQGGSSPTFIEKTLTDGTSFNDSINGITVTQVSHSASGVVFDVNFAPVCLKAAPSVSISPASASGNAGDALSYSLTLTNKDNAVCPASTATIASAVPSGWSQSPVSFTETLAPGASVTRSFTVTSSPTASAGTYNFTETATQNGLSGSKSAAYVVNSPVTPPPPPPPVSDTVAPTVTISKPLNNSTVPKKGSLALAAAAKDNVAVTKLELYLDTALVKTCAAASCKGSVNVSTIATGNHTVTAKAYDAAGNIGEAAMSVTK